MRSILTVPPPITTWSVNISFTDPTVEEELTHAFRGDRFGDVAVTPRVELRKGAFVKAYALGVTVAAESRAEVIRALNARFGARVAVLPW